MLFGALVANAAHAKSNPAQSDPANAAPAQAAPVNAAPVNAAPVQSDERVQVIVMDLTPRGGVEEDAAQTLTTMMATELSAYENLQVTSGEDIRKMMDLDSVKAKAGCGDDASCVAEIAGALGAPYAVYGTVSALGPYTLLHLSLFDVAAAKNISREAVRVKESFELLDRVPRALANLTAPVRDTG